MTRPKHTRRDTNQLGMVAILRSLGYICWDTADLGGNVLDLVVFKDGQTRVVEVKRPGQRHMLTQNEQASIDALDAVGVEAIVAETWRDVTEAWEER